MDKRQFRDTHNTPVTPAQQRVLDVIRRHLEEHNRTPTIRQICEELGLKSTFSVSTQINRLQKTVIWRTRYWRKANEQNRTYQNKCK